MLLFGWIFEVVGRLSRRSWPHPKCSRQLSLIQQAGIISTLTTTGSADVREERKYLKQTWSFELVEGTLAKVLKKNQYKIFDPKGHEATWINPMLAFCGKHWASLSPSPINQLSELWQKSGIIPVHSYFGLDRYFKFTSSLISRIDLI